MADDKTTLAPLTTSTPTQIGSPVAPNPNKVTQTTINTDTTTINPNSSITNPVKPDGSPAPDEIKRAVVPAATGAPLVPIGGVQDVKTTTAKPEGSER